MRVRELAEWLGATFEGDGEKELTGVAPLETAGGSELSFLGGRKALQQADSSAAGCLIVPPDYPSPSRRTVIHAPERSEEHTSELQSLRHLVCRLLLEKKKNRN